MGLAMGAAMASKGNSKGSQTDDSRYGHPELRNVARQTLSFELPHLPGEEFRIAIPELVSDAKKPIMPWGHPSPEFDFEQNRARCLIEIPGSICVEATVSFLGERIDTLVKATNLSSRPWEHTNAFTCFAYYAAPSFYDRSLTRTYFPVDGKWKAVTELFKEHDPGGGRYTFFPVSGGPQLEDLWACREIQQFHPQTVSQGAACVTSLDQRWVAGVFTPSPAFLFVNRVKTCIHADPLMGTVGPGQTGEGLMSIHIFRGTPADFAKRCRT